MCLPQDNSVTLDTYHLTFLHLCFINSFEWIKNKQTSKWTLPGILGHPASDLTFINLSYYSRYSTYFSILPCDYDVCVLVTQLLSNSFVTPWTVVLLCPWKFPGKNTRAGCNSLLQGIFLAQGSPALQADSLPSEPPGKLRW